VNIHIGIVAIDIGDVTINKGNVAVGFDIVMVANASDE